MSSRSLSNDQIAAVTGGVRFASDFLPRRDALHVCVVRSPFARAEIEASDTTQALAVSGVRSVLTHGDVSLPGTENAELELLAGREVRYFGQPVALVVAETEEAAAAGAEAVQISYRPLPPILKISEALAVSSFHGEAEEFGRGDVDKALGSAEHRIEGRFEIGSQDPKWPDSASAIAEPDGLGGLRVFASVASPQRLQETLARALGVAMSMIRIDLPPRRAAESSVVPAALASLAAWHTGSAVSVAYSAEESRYLRARRPAVGVEFQAACNHEGRLLALDVTLAVDGGCMARSADGFFVSALNHIDNAYWLPNLRLKVQIVRTNRPACGTDSGVVSAQAVFAVEEIIGRMARRLGLLPEVVRQRNFYHPEGIATTTPAELPVDAANVLLPLWKQILTSSNFAARRKAITAWNARNQFAKRGLAATPVKMALGDPASSAVQSSALVHILPDASVQIFADVAGSAQSDRLRACAAEEIGVPAHAVRVLPASTDQASPVRIGDMVFPQLGEQAVRHAFQRLRERLLPLATVVFQQNGAPGIGADDIDFLPGRVASRSNPNLGFSFESFVRFAAARHVDLSASGSAFVEESARPYHGFIFGAAVSEVQVDSFTGQVRVLRSDLVHESGSGDRMNGGAAPRLRAAFLEGLGWLLNETDAIAEDGTPYGKLAGGRQAALSLAPGIADAPLDFRVEVIETPERPGDPWLGGYALALSLREALRDAIASFGSGRSGERIELPVPATPEAVFRQIHQQRAAKAKVAEKD